MRKRKQRLAFEQLETEMFIIRSTEMSAILGGASATAQDLVNYMLNNNVSYMSSGGIDEWWTNNSSNFGGAVSSNSSDGYFLGVTTLSSNGGSSGYGDTGYGNTNYGQGGGGGAPQYVRTGAQGTPTISIGSLTPSGISQSVDFNNFGTSYVPNYGGYAAFVSTKGTIGYSQNSDGKWVINADFSVRPPASFVHEQVTGNVKVLVNGSVIGTFALNDARQQYPSVVYEQGTIPVTGLFNMPSNFNGQGLVTFEINTGAVENDGNSNYYSNSSHTVGLVLKPIN